MRWAVELLAVLALALSGPALATGVTQEGIFDRAIECYQVLLQRYPDAPEAAEAAPRLEELEAGQ